jgi:hypothetical protein
MARISTDWEIEPHPMDGLNQEQQQDNKYAADPVTCGCKHSKESTSYRELSRSRAGVGLTIPRNEIFRPIGSPQGVIRWED